MDFACADDFDNFVSKEIQHSFDILCKQVMHVSGNFHQYGLLLHFSGLNILLCRKKSMLKKTQINKKNKQTKNKNYTSIYVCQIDNPLVNGWKSVFQTNGPKKPARVFFLRYNEIFNEILSKQMGKITSNFSKKKSTKMTS